ncbi:MAG: radical SAM protein [Candidatus Omnitrophica bacterium]|nr:radical SAM protein [Candidatus Omnitrophota bacterium]
MKVLNRLIFKYLTNIYSSYAKLQRFFLGTHALPPVRLYFYMTNKCNCFCHYCDYAGNSCKDYITGLPNKDELSFNDVKNVVDQLHSKTVITFSGGEPTLAKDFYKAIEYAAKRRQVQLITNGTTMNMERIEKLIDWGIWIINFSLDAPVGEIHDAYRGHDGLVEKIIGLIEGTKRIKKARGLKNPLIQINTVILKQSIPYLPAMVELAAKLEIDWLSFAILRDNNGIRGDGSREFKGIADYSQEDLALLKEKLGESIKRAKELDVTLRFSEELKNIGQLKEGVDMSRFACYAPWTSFWVWPNGEASICHIALGDIRKNRLQDLWKNKIARDSRRNYSLGQKELPSKCQGCCLVFPK